MDDVILRQIINFLALTSLLLMVNMGGMSAVVRPFKKVDPAKVLQRYAVLDRLEPDESKRVKELELEMGELEDSFKIENWQACLTWDKLDAEYSNLTGLHRIPRVDNFQVNCQNIKLALEEIKKSLEYVRDLAEDKIALHNFNIYLRAMYNLDEAGNLFKEAYSEYEKIVDSSPELAQLLVNVQKLAPEIEDNDDESEQEEDLNADSEGEKVDSSNVSEVEDLDQGEAESGEEVGQAVPESHSDDDDFL